MHGGTWHSTMKPRLAGVLRSRNWRVKHYIFVTASQVEDTQLQRILVFE
jgi:hypothetical protein